MKRKPNQQALEALNAHAGLILRAAARVLGSIDEAQDVAQDLAEKLLRKPPGTVRSWPALLKSMAVNASIDRIRRRREWGEAPEAVTEETPETIFGRKEKAAALRRAIGQLSEREGQLFSFCYLADLSHAEIGRALGMNPNAVSVALHRVRKKLVTLLKEVEPGAGPEGELE